MTDRMLLRFSLYGFLKNQQYFEPFILLAFLQMGLSFTLIGLLIGFRQLLINFFEIPSGAIADLFGRRRALLFSFACYIVSFTIMGAAVSTNDAASLNPFLFPVLLLAMGFYALADAFRSGTHKALIFTHLRRHGLTDQRTKVYGFTRSWSKIGSALSVMLACIFVFYSDNFIWVFYFSIIPFLLNMINVGTYPKYLDGGRRKEKSGSMELVSHLISSCQVALAKPDFRRLIIESMGFEGFFKATKDYLQPILKMAALPLSALLFADLQLGDTQKTVILIGPIYVLIYLGSAVASRQSHVLSNLAGGDEKATKIIWFMTFGIFISLVPAFYFNVFWVMIPGLILMHLLQNVWRPIFISRIDAHGDEAKGATLLSIQSQAQSIATMIIAPVLGFCIDIARDIEGAGEFWPIAVFGALIALVFILPRSQYERVH